MSRETLKQARRDKGMTQQTVADYLNITLRHYQRIESAFTVGPVEIWDALEDFLGIPQRKLRETLNIRRGQAENQPVHPENPQERLA